MPTDCPCGSGATYDACCGPLHAGTATAQTPEQLMRSRYSAFVVQDEAYLLATWHASTRPPSLEFEPDVHWRRLKILSQTGGTETDDTATVEFIAHYWDEERREYGRQQENSHFVRRGDRWLYVDAVAEPL